MCGVFYILNALSSNKLGLKSANEKVIAKSLIQIDEPEVVVLKNVCKKEEAFTWLRILLNNLMEKEVPRSLIIWEDCVSYIVAQLIENIPPIESRREYR